MVLDNLYEQLRNRLPMPDVARFYGLEVNWAGFAVCPFHPDNHPSLKIYDDHYHCYGCGAHGDVTDFVARLFDISQYDAAKKLDYDFGLNLTNHRYHTTHSKPINPEIAYRNWLYSTERILNDYLNLLCRWKVQYTPKRPEEPLHPHFVESLTNMESYQYLYQQIKFGSDSEKRMLYLTEQETIRKLTERMKQHDIAKSAVKRRMI